MPPKPKPTPVEVLNTAADYIEAHGLNIGEYWPGAATGTPYRAGTPCCALGAIAVALKPNKPDKTTALVSDAANTLRDRVSKLAGYRRNLVQWNDASTADEVVATMRRPVQ